MKKEWFDVTVEREDGSTYIEIVQAVGSEEAMQIARDNVSIRHKILNATVW